MRMVTRFALVLTVSALAVLNLQAQLSPEISRRIDASVEKVTKETAVPSVSLAVIKDGSIAYLHAYGNSSLEPAISARPEMRYCIGSVSKQFMAIAILLLVQDGRLKLEDPVALYLPNLTRVLSGRRQVRAILDSVAIDLQLFRGTPSPRGERGAYVQK